MKNSEFVSNMLEKVYTHLNDNDNTLKVMLENSQNNLKANNELFFNRLKQISDEKLNQKLFTEKLLLAAQQCGFNNLAEALNLSRNKDDQSPLHYAFQQQNFRLAKKLMDSGAIAGPLERAAFEVAADSKAARQFGITPESIEAKKLHIVKDYGLVLGIKMTSQDGTSSQIAHMAPTYALMTDAVSEYAQKNKEDKNFQKIAEAFAFSNDAADFSYSTSQNPKAGNELAARIQRGELTTIPIGCKGHVMGLSIVPDGKGAGQLVYTNRGLGAQPGEHGTQIYQIDDLSKVTPKFINSVMNGLSDGLSYEEVMSKVHGVTGNKPPIHHISQEAQRVDNCTIANPRSNIEGILLCQKAQAKGGFDNLNEQDCQAVKSQYKAFTHDMRVSKIEQLADAIKKSPNDPDLNKLARSYLEQHPHAHSDLKRPLEEALKLEISSKPAAREFSLSQVADTKNMAATQAAKMTLGEITSDTHHKEAVDPGPSKEIKSSGP